MLPLLLLLALLLILLLPLLLAVLFECPPGDVVQIALVPAVAPVAKTVSLLPLLALLAAAPSCPEMELPLCWLAPQLCGGATGLVLGRRGKSNAEFGARIVLP